MWNSNILFLIKLSHCGMKYAYFVFSLGKRLRPFCMAHLARVLVCIIHGISSYSWAGNLNVYCLAPNGHCKRNHIYLVLQMSNLNKITICYLLTNKSFTYNLEGACNSSYKLRWFWTSSFSCIEFRKQP